MQLVRVWLAVLALLALASISPATSGPSDPFARERSIAARSPRHGVRLDGDVARLGGGEVDGRGGGYGEVRVGLARYGRGARWTAVSAAQVHVAGPEARIDRGPGIVEWWRSLPSGLEQGVTIAERPAGEGALELEMTVGAAVRVEPAGNAAILRDARTGEALARYGGLYVSDARGAPIPARLAARGDRLRIIVDDADARYPLVVDPLLSAMEEGVLTRPSGPVLNQGYGRVLAVDGTASTVLVGNPAETRVDVHVRSGTMWSFQGTMPVPTLTGAGSSLAISGDGSRALVGIAGDAPDGTMASATSFERSGTSWVSMGSITHMIDALTRTCVDALAMDATGRTAVVGCGNVGSGYASVLVFDEGTRRWDVTADLDGLVTPGSESKFGQFVAISGDGAVAVVADQNRATVFRRAAAWMIEQTLTTGSAIRSLALASGGERIALGCIDGTVVFGRTGSTWSEEARLSPSVPFVAQGSSVAFDAAGARLAVGAAGVLDDVGASVELYERRAGTWVSALVIAQPDPPPLGSFGNGVALSDDGTRLTASYLGDTIGTRTDAGSVRVYVVAPTTPLGSECSSDATCESGFCADGVCCDEACGDGNTTDCRACLGAQTGRTDGTCARRLATEVCRPARPGGCDVAETCMGGDTCPVDAVRTGGFECRASAGDCDPPEVCDGFGDVCPGNALAANGARCGDDPLSCSTSGTCDGVTPTCGGGGMPRARGYICGRADPFNPCDRDDACDGFGVCVPVVQPASTVCGLPASGEPCDADDHCDGTLPVCIDALRVGTVCRPSTGGCDPEEICLGGSATCEDDAVGLLGSVCRASIDPSCDPAESCDGVSGACPPDAITCEMPDAGELVRDTGVPDAPPPGADAGPPAPAVACGCRASLPAEHGAATIAILALAAALARRRHSSN